MVKCAIKKCDKQTEYFLYFVLIDDDDDRILGKTLRGCFCANHAMKKKEEYEMKWGGRNVQVIAERETREKADKEREEEIKNWHKVKPTIIASNTTIE